MVSELIAPCDPRWTRSLADLAHDVYDLPGYSELCALHEKAKPIAFYAEDRGRLCLIPLLLRPLPVRLGVPQHWMDAISPYGYSSALFRGDRNWVSEAAKALVEVCRENNVVSAFIRLNPLIPIAAEVRTMIGTQVTHGTTIAVDLKLTREELGKQMRPSHRRDIVRLLRNNFIAAVDHWLAYDQFVAIYRETMDRLNANSYYRFSPDYFARLKTTLGDHLHIVSVCAPDGDLAAAGLFTEINGIVQYHLSGSSGAYGNLAPTKLMLDVAISWAKGENNHVLHLGGGVGGKEDDLFRFKSGFSKNKLPFETWRIITDASKYSELVTTSSGTAHETQAFFPEYRVPSLNEL